jgi:hypothetical protein
MRAKFDNGQWRPLIEVTLIMGGASQLVWMMLDSGADQTTISPDLATALTGLPFDQLGDPGPEILGLGNAPTPSRVADATVVYLGHSVRTRLWVAPTPYPVVGRNDFMQRFHCRFYWDRQPPEFFVEPATFGASAGRHGGPQQVNPTIRPKKKRRRM